jgi:hypothetical protein
MAHRILVQVENPTLDFLLERTTDHEGRTMTDLGGRFEGRLRILLDGRIRG